jgi:hypothetical protein
VTVKKFKRCCVSDDMNERQNGEESENTGSGHESVSSICKKGDAIVTILKLLRQMIRQAW